MKQKKKNLIIYGDSSYAEMIAHYFQTDSEYQVVAYSVDKAYRTREEIDGLPIIALEDIEKHYDSKDHHIFAAIGYKSVRTHKMLFEKVAKLSFPVASYISSQAIVDSSCKVGINCLILPGVILEPNTIIEKNCFINSAAIVCHHTLIKAHSILAAGSVIGGHTSIGESSLIGFNATVAELLHLGTETLLGAGSLLLQNTEDHTLYLGSPAKAIRKHTDSGIVLSSK
ncbi:MAG TPA: acetyltransferase [Sulfurovum sp.]|nr:acetyltransferase [Sulfurovum sp.]